MTAPAADRSTGSARCPSPGKPLWEFNGNFESPTFVPSLMMRHGDSAVCHLFLRNGVLEFLSDCTHELAGQKVPLEP